MLSIHDLPNPSYFRVALQKSTGDTYFGQIKNSSGNWVEIKSLSSDCRDYYLLAATGSSQLNLSLKTGDLSGLTSGLYSVVGHRFTTTSCSGTKSINNLALNLNITSPTPTPTQIPPTPTMIPTQTPRAATPTPSSTPVPSLKPTLTPVPSLLPQVLALETTAIPSPTLNSEPSPILIADPINHSYNFLPVLSIYAGLFLVGFALVRVY